MCIKYLVKFTPRSLQCICTANYFGGLFRNKADDQAEFPVVRSLFEKMIADQVDTPIFTGAHASSGN